uniref:G-protein coupled receptors family 1 profile domain-containing protein n=1 Tax=Equus caballus TaxID=9796 RepID=A0A9L0S8A5_HORSE
ASAVLSHHGSQPLSEDGCWGLWEWFPCCHRYYYATWFHLCYHGPNISSNFFLDIIQIIFLSCSNPFISHTILFLVCIFVGFSSFLVISLSYVFVSPSILKISSVKGSAKACNTCASHLVVVTIFYGTSLSVCLLPSSSHSNKQDNVLLVFYVIFIPMLNPLIYSLRKRAFKEALKRVVKRLIHLPQ